MSNTAAFERKYKATYLMHHKYYKLHDAIMFRHAVICNTIEYLYTAHSTGCDDKRLYLICYVIFTYRNERTYNTDEPHSEEVQPQH